MKLNAKIVYSLLCAFIFSLCIGNANAQTTAEIAKGNCKACAIECEKTLTYCNKKGGQYSQNNIVSALKDCITACKTSEGYLSRGSSQATKGLSMCVDACMNCAKSCESFKDDNAMRACADECRKCAGNCGKL